MKKIVIVILLMLVGTVICFAQPKTKTFSKDGISFEYEKDWTVQSFGGLIVAVCKGNTFSINKITNNSDEEIFEAYLQSTYKIKEEEVGSDYITKIIDRTLNGIETRSFDVKYSVKEYRREFIFEKNGILIHISMKCNNERTIDSDFATFLRSFHFEPVW